jgi:hypothetical protein
MLVKSLIKILISVILSISLIISIGIIFSSAVDSKIHISTYEELDAVRNNLSGQYVLDNDIVVPSGLNFTPIGTFNSPFYGNFDGNSHTISGMAISATTSAEDVASIGLFGCVSGNIDNLTVNGTINGTFTTENTVYAGLITGCIKSNGKIQNAVASGSIIVTSSGNSFPVCTGGIAGAVINSRIINCLNTATINTSVSTGSTNTVYVGGIVGYTFCTSIIECSNEAAVSAINNNIVTNTSDAYLLAGGIAGYVNNRTTVNKSYNIGDITINGDKSVYKNAGGIAGMIYKSSVIQSYSIGIISKADNSDVGSFCGVANDAAVTQSYVLNSNISACAHGSCNVIEATAYQMSNQDSLPFFDFTNTWEFDSTENYPYPILKNTVHGSLTFNPLCGISNYSMIYNYNDLLSISNDPTKNYVLMNDITLTSSQPITSSLADTFSGTFYGNGHSINNVSLSGDTVGLFSVNNGTVSGLTVNIVSFSGYTESLTTGIIALNNTGKISECTAAVSVASISANSIVFGGITTSNTGIVEHCSLSANNLNLSADTIEFGGISANNGQNGREVFSTVSGNLTAATGSNAYSYIFAGGISNENEEGSISNCSTDISFNFTTSTHHSRVYCSGIAAQNYSTVNHCETSGTIAVNSFGNTYVGGIVGTNEEGSVTNCRALSNIDVTLTSPGYVFTLACGGIAGRNSGTLSNSFTYDTVTSQVISDKTIQNYTGGAVGYNNYGTITNCFYNNSCTLSTGYNSSTSIECSYASAEQLTSGEVAYALGSDFGMIIATDNCPQFNDSQNTVYKFLTSPIKYENKPYILISTAELGAEYLTGLRVNLKTSEIGEYIVPAVGFTISDLNSENYIGTGNVITVNNSENVVMSSFTSVIYGDINSDGQTDAEDSVIIRAIVSGALTSKDITSAQYEALDCNHDGTVNESDAEILEQSGLSLNTVNQSK